MEEQNAENKLEENQTSNINNNPSQDVAPINPAYQAPRSGENIQPVKYAGFWIRWVAVFIDGIVVAIMAVPIMIAFYFLSGGIFSEDGETSSGFNLLGYLISWGYYIYMTDKYQATLGKRAMGIIVVNEDFSKASLGNIILRETVGKIISGIILMIGYIMAAFTDRKRALHDMISGTVVIYKK